MSPPGAACAAVATPLANPPACEHEVSNAAEPANTARQTIRRSFMPETLPHTSPERKPQADFDQFNERRVP